MQQELPSVAKSPPRTLSSLSDDDRRFFLNRHAIRRRARELSKLSSNGLTPEQIIAKFTVDQIMSGDFSEDARV
jgi:hypothetical protein